MEERKCDHLNPSNLRPFVFALTTARTVVSPEVIAAAQAALENDAELSSVRFICGTQNIHSR